MKKSKLITALQTLTEAELPEFRRFLASPYFNQREELVAFYDWLTPYYPDFTSPRLSKKQVAAVIFPGRAYDDKAVRYLMSDLYRLLEQFWVCEKQRKDTRRGELVLLEHLVDKQLDKAYRQVDRRLASRFSGAAARDHRFFRDSVSWYEVRERQFQLERRRRYDDSIQQAADHLDRYYYLQRLRYACAMLDRQAIIKGDYQLRLSDGWIEHLQGQDFFGEPLIRLYFTILQALLHEKEEHFFDQLKEQLSSPAGDLPKADLRDVYLFSINYCARKIRKGAAHYVYEALALYTAGIESGLLLDQGELSPWAFTNVVKLALRLQRYQWIEAFIQQYGGRLPRDFRENALHYNLAELYYYTRRFDQARAHLNEVAYSDLNYYLGARVLLAKIYYETEDHEPLLSLLAAFTIFLKRNKELSAELKQTYLNFCQILYQLVRRNARRLAELDAAITQTPLLTDRAWLRKQYDELVEEV